MSKQVKNFDNSKAIIVFPGICKILDKWKCSLRVKSALLGFYNAEGFQVMLSDPDTYTFSNEQIERMSYILNIYRSLHTFLSDPLRADNWVNVPNTALLFKGKPAMDMIKKGKISDLELVARYLQSFY